MESLNTETKEHHICAQLYDADHASLAIEHYPELKESIQSVFKHGIEEIVIAPHSLLSVGLGVLPEDTYTLSAICDVDGVYPGDTPRQYPSLGWLHIFFTAMKIEEEVEDEEDLHLTTLTKMVLLTKYTPGYHRGGSMTTRRM